MRKQFVTTQIRIILSLAFLGLMSAALLVLPASAASTDSINLQGKVSIKTTGINPSAGSPSCVVSGADTCDFRVRYYDAATSGTLLGGEEFSNVEIGDYEGVFKLSLGTGSFSAGSESTLSNVFLNHTSVYTEIGFDPAGGNSYTETFLTGGNRMQVRAVPYALQAVKISWSGLMDPTTGLTLNHGTNTTTFNFALSTGTAFTQTYNSLIGGTGLSVTSAAVASTSNLANFELTGSNSSNTGSVLRAAVSGTSSLSTALMVTNLGNTGSTSFRVNDQTGDADTTPFIIDASGNVGIQTTSLSNVLEVAGTGRFSSTLTASNGLTLTTGALNLTATSGSVSLTGFGTTSITSTTATGAINSLINNSITSGTVLNVTSNSNGVTSGGLSLISLSQSAATGTTVNGNIESISAAITYSTAITTPALSGNTLNISRSVTTNTSFASTLTLSGAVASISDTAVQSTGTLTSTADVLRVLQSYTNNSGSAVDVAAGGGASGLALRVNDDGSFADASPFIIDNSGNVGIQTTSISNTLEVSGTGRFSSTLTASSGLTLTTGALSLTGTSGSIALTGYGTTSITSTTATGAINSFVDNSLTSGTVLNATSTANGLTSGALGLISLAQSAATGTTVNGNVAGISFAPTYSTAITTPTISGNTLNVSRSVTTNTSFASTLTLSGAVASISDSPVQTTGTLTSTADVLRLSQAYANNSGSVLDLAAGGGSSGYGLRVNDDGTSSDSTPFVIDNSGNVGIQTTTISNTLEVAGTSRFSSTLTASNGFTLTTGALNLTATSGSIALTGFGTSSVTSTTTTGNIFTVANTSFAVAGTATGNLANLPFTNTSANTSNTAITTGLNISATNNAVGSGGTQETYGIRIQALAGTSGAGTQNNYGIRIGNQGLASTEASRGLYIDAQTGSTANYGAVFAGGNVGIGTTTPGALLDLGTAGSTAGAMRLAGSTSGNVTINVQAAAGTWTLTLPTTDGNNNEVLKTNGSGATFWAAQTGGGIGTWDTITDPAANLTLNHGTYTTTFNFANTTTTAFTNTFNSLTSGKGLAFTSSASALTGKVANFELTGSNSGNTGSILRAAVSGTSSLTTALMVTNLGAGAGVRVNDQTGDTDTTPFLIDAEGNVGILTALPAPTPVAPVSTAAPVAYWNMNEASWTNDCSTATVLDSSGNGYNAKSCPAGSGPTTTASGRVSRAGNFDGSNDQVLVPNSFVLPSLNGTLSAWVYRTAGGAYFIADVSGSGNEFNIYYNSVGFYIGGTDYRITPYLQVSENSWTYLTVTWSSAGTKMYYNGVLVGHNTVAPAAWTETGLSLGADFGGGNPFQGRIDEVRVYNYARSQSQIIEDMNSGSTPATPPAPMVWWKMDEPAFSNDCGVPSVSDSSGNGYNASSCPGTTGLSTTVQGVINNAANFDGIDDYIKTNTDFIVPDLVGTISMWVYPAGGNYFLIADGPCCNDEFDWTNNAFGFYIGGTPYWVSGMPDPQPSKWTYITLTWDQTNGSILYYNGSVIGTNSTPPPSLGKRAMVIGGDWNGGSNYKGRMDEVKVYTVALTQDEILAEMQKIADNGPRLQVAGTTVIVGTGEGATPSAATIRGAATTGTNTTGGIFTIDASNGTGSGLSGAIVFRTAPTAGSSGTANTLAERMRIAANGNVGIGTNSPGALFDLGTAGSTAGLMRLAGSTSGNVSITTAATAGTWTLTLPTTAGNAGDILKTNGSGVTSWVTPAAPDDDWAALADPTVALTINHGTNETFFDFANTTTTAFTNTYNSLTSGTGLKIASSAVAQDYYLANFELFGSNSGNTGSILRAAVSGASSLATPLMVTNLGSGFAFVVNDNTDDDDPTAFIVNATGNVGIGNRNPGAMLDLGLAGTLAGTVRFAGSTSGNVTITTAANAGTWALTLPTTAGTNTYVLKTDGSGATSWVAQPTGSNSWSAIGDPTANLTLNHGTFATTFNFANTTTTAFVQNYNNLTSGTGLIVGTGTADTLTSGIILNVTSAATSITTPGAGKGSLATFDWSPSSGTATGDLFGINIGANGSTSGNIFSISRVGTGVFTISELMVKASVPASFNAVNSTEVAYDMVFSNQTSSAIRTSSPLTIDVGEPFEANNLKFKTYNQGSVVVDSGVTTSGAAFSIPNSSMTTGTLVSLSATGALTTTGNLLTVTANAATTPTGLVVVNATGLTTGAALDINVNGATSLTSGAAINVDGPTGAAAIAANSGLVKIVATGAITTTTGAGNGGLLNVQGNAIITGTLASISDTAVMTTTGKLLDLTANSATTVAGLLKINATDLTTGFAMEINTAGTTTMTSGSGLKITGNTGAAAISTNGGLVQLTATGAFTTSTGAGSGGILNIRANATVAGTIASITDTAVMTTTGNLLTLTADAATTTTGLLTQNASGLTTGRAIRINVNGAAVLTSGGALNVEGPTGAAAISANSGLVKISATGAMTTTAGAGSGGLLDVQANAIISGTLASISDTAVMTTTGNLLTLTANSATTTTGLLTMNGSGLTTGRVININVDGGTTLTDGGALDVDGPTGAAAISANSGLVKITSAGAFTTQTGAGSGGLLNIQADAVISGTLASISDTAVMTTTGKLLDLTAGAATTATGLLTLNASGLTSGYAFNINKDGATSITSGGAINIVGPTGAAAISANSGLVKISATGAFTTGTGAGSGGLLNLEANAVITGTVASISDTAIMTTTGKLLDLTANSATTATGLLTINGTGLTTGAALKITSGTGFALNVVSTGSILDFASATAGNTMVIRVPTNSAGQGGCATATAEGVIFQNSAGTQIGRLACVANATTQLTMFGQVFTAASTDLAEMYSTRLDDHLVAGDVVSFANSGNLMLRKSNKAYDSQIAGVISDDPGLRMTGISEADGSADTVNGRYVALKGRVPVKVNSENGPIAIGDYLTSSSTAGVAMKATGRGVVIGQALDAYNGNSVGLIRVYVSNGWYDPQAVASKVESFAAETEIQAGDIVVPGANYVTTENGESLVKLTRATTTFSDSVIGVAVPRQTDFDAQDILDTDNPMPIALSGRVPVKIDPASAAISAGDPITTSDVAGKATKAVGTGTIIGKAVENWTPGTDAETVLVALDLSWYTPDRLLFESMLADYEAGTLGGTGGNIGQSGASHWTIDQDGNLTTEDDLSLGNFKATLGIADTINSTTLDIGTGVFTVDAAGEVVAQNNMNIDGNLTLTKTQTSDWMLVTANNHADFDHNFGFNPKIVKLQEATNNSGANKTTRGFGVDYYYEFSNQNQIRVFNTTNQNIYIQVKALPVH